MPLHPAFWPTGDQPGGVRGLWDGSEITIDPASPSGAEGPVLADDADAAPVSSYALDRALRLAAANFDHVLDRQLRSVTSYGPAALTELAHIMIGMPRHAAIAASDAADRPLAEALTKLAIHWMRAEECWRDLARHLTGAETDDLQPLPTTLALQLAFEELATSDTLAYTWCAARFGLPGDRAATRRITDVAAIMAGQDAKVATFLADWADRVSAVDGNYASVRSLRDMGSLQGVDIPGLAATSRGPVSLHGLRKSLGAMRELSETTALFAFGIGQFFGDERETFPRRRPAWAGV